MAPGTSTLCIWLLFLCCCVSLSQGQLALDCCLRVSYAEIPKIIVKRYERQVKGHGCDINAIVVTSKGGHKLCAPTEPKWVRELMTFVDNRATWCNTKEFKPKRCHGLKSEQI